MTAPTDALTALQARIGDRYRLERELGGGGMSRVVVATDPELGRRVVLKLLSSEVAEGISAERFGREIRLAAQLQDPHIVPVLASGTTSDGVPYYTMPFVEGESLRQRLERGAVPVDDALRLLRDVAEALEYAHARGVVHRDIKPENILLAGRNAVVADFGIAKAVSAARTQGDGSRPMSATLTSAGTSLGTPAYMAPEQAAGEAVDHRADLYAWGMVAYELLAGRHPFADKAGLQQLLTAQLGEMPRAIDAVRPGVPAALGALVMRCLAKEAASRPASATAVLGALGAIGSGVGSDARGAAVRPRRTGLLAAAGVTLAALVAGGAWLARGRAGADVPTTPAIAVLPFEHRGDSTDSYVTDGLADELRGKLAGVRELVVIARGSTAQYRGTTKPPQEIARELGVRWLLTATVQVIGSGPTRRVIVRPELVEITGTGVPQTRWSQPFDVQGADATGLQGRIASDVMGAMEVTVAAEDRARALTVATRDQAAYDAYLRGRAADSWGANTNPEALARAGRFYAEAVQRDSMLVEAWSELAITSVLRFANGDDMDPRLTAQALDAVERVERLVPGTSEALRVRASYLRFAERQRGYDRARTLLEQAARLAPGDVRFANSLGLLLFQELGRTAEAVPYFERGRTLDPRSPRAALYHAQALLGLGRLAEARAAADRALALDPNTPTGALARVTIEVVAADTTRARAVAMAAARDLRPGRDLLTMGAVFGWLLDRTALARADAVEASALGDERGEWTVLRARARLWAGDTTGARALADTAVRLLTSGAASRTASADRLGGMAWALTIAGRPRESMPYLVRAKRVLDGGFYGRGNVYALRMFSLAAVATIAGERDSALAWLATANRVASGSDARNAAANPTFRALWGDPRFTALVTAARARAAAR